MLFERAQDGRHYVLPHSILGSIGSTNVDSERRSEVQVAFALELFKLFFNGEFDPGSGRTLAACLIHASRTRTRELAPCNRVANG